MSTVIGKAADLIHALYHALDNTAQHMGSPECKCHEPEAFVMEKADGDALNEAFSIFTGGDEDGHEAVAKLRKAEASLASANALLAEAKAEIHFLKGAPEPRAFDLAQWSDWLRLLREVRGYMHTCWRQHDGGDRKGRDFAQAGLEKMEKTITSLMVGASKP